MGRDQRYSREDALNTRLFLQLYLGALKIENDEQRIRTVMTILCAGRLAMRASEIQHLHEGWIDWERGEIRIPAHDPCFCKWCLDSAAGKIATKKDVPKTEIERDDDDVLEYVYENQYEPKPGASARVVPFGWSKRITAWLLRFFSDNEYLDVTQQQMRNDVRKAAEFAEGVDPSGLTLHPLRATGITFYADAGINPKACRDLVGHGDIAESRRYLRASGRQLTAQVYEVFDREGWSPDVVPEDPEKKFPIACNPGPLAGETDLNVKTAGPAARRERADERADDPLRLYNPRRERRPDDVSYDPSEHTLPGHVDPESPVTEEMTVKHATGNADLREWIGYVTDQNDPPGEQVDRQSDIDDHNIYGPVAGVAQQYWTKMDPLVEWIQPRWTELWDTYIGVDTKDWMRQSTPRWVAGFAFYMALATVVLMLLLIDSGLYRRNRPSALGLDPEGEGRKLG